MEKIKQNVRSLMERLDYPAYAQKEILDTLDGIAADKVAKAWLFRLIAQYDANENCDYKQMLLDIRALGDCLGIHEDMTGMLLFLCLAEKLRERYAERGIDESIYYNSMADLRYKLEECRLIHGRVGTFVADWYAGFFKLTRFALGRLQFEIINYFKDAYTVAGVELPAGSKVINIHIPRTGTKLDHDEVLESYRMAAEMFGPQLGDAPVAFACTSWMLFPWHETVMSPTSNMMAFYHDFKIVDEAQYKDYAGVWRLFDRPFDENLDALPTDTSLRRAYIDLMKRGEPTGWGRGIFIWKDGKVLN